MKFYNFGAMKRVAILFLLLFVGAFAQDTLRFLDYNLLHYGTGSPSVTQKNNYLKTIIGYIKPDIFGANEITNNAVYSQNILQNVLEVLDGQGSWGKAQYTNYAQTDLTNMLFFKTKYFGLKSQKTVTGFVRDMNIYNLYYHKPGYDSIFFTVVVVHLKAAQSGASERAQMAQALMDTLNNMNPKYLIVMGDLNLYTSSEQAFQTFTNYPNPSIRLRDPANRVGDWHNNPSFSDVHTQATRFNSLGDGGSTSGLDDRFDFILCNTNLFNTSNEMYVLPNTYTVVGQDGNHYDKGLLDPPTNTSVPGNVLNALYYNSDHLPVSLDIVFNPKSATTVVLTNDEPNIEYNSIVNDVLKITYKNSIKPFRVTIYDITGKEISEYFTKDIIDLGSLQEGLYFFRINDSNELYKFIKVQ